MLKVDCNTEEKQPVRVGNRIVGSIEGSKFVKHVVGSRHRLTKPSAWCVSAQVFEEQIKPYATEIVVEDRESGLSYQTSVETFAKYCFEIQRGSFERQLALTLRHWEERGNGYHQLDLWEGQNGA